jgi:nucleotide-binding universal stress UspA family protein
MQVLIWVTEAGWAACVDHVRRLVPGGARITLLAVIDDGAAALAERPGPGRFGHRRAPPAAAEVGEAAAAQAHTLLDAAAQRLARDGVARETRRGRVEHEVARAAQAADLLVLARDGEDRRGPRSLGPRARFVVDHAACEVLLVWPVARAERDDRPLPPPPPPPPPPRE